VRKKTLKQKPKPADKQATESSIFPLAERLKAYAREDEIKSSASKVVELKKPDQR
jgi:hypothetical protein